MRVLDYGCGSGKFTIPTSRMVGCNGVVYALDIDDKALQTIRRLAESQGLTNINYIHWSEGSELPIDSHSLDLVLLIDVIQEIPDWDRLFRILTSLLKIGGIIAVFPMHISINKVIETATRTGLSYQGRAVKEKFLTFRAQAL